MRRPALALAAVLGIGLLGCTGEPRITAESITESLHALAEASGQDTVHEVRVNDGVAGRSVTVDLIRGGRAESWSQDPGGEPTSTEQVVARGGRAFTPDEVPAERITELLARDDCDDSASVIFAVTPSENQLFTSRCDDAMDREHPETSWLDDEELPKLPAEWSAELWSQLLDEVGRILPDGKAVVILATLMEGQTDVLVTGEHGPMGHPQDCAVSYLREVGPTSSKVSLTQCEPSTADVEVFFAGSVSGDALMRATERAADELGVTVADLRMVRVHDRGEGLQVQAYGPDGAVTVPVN